MQEEDQYNNTYSILDLFRTPRLRNITLLLIVIWMSISLVCLIIVFLDLEVEEGAQLGKKCHGEQIARKNSKYCGRKKEPDPYGSVYSMLDQLGFIANILL